MKKRVKMVLVTVVSLLLSLLLHAAITRPRSTPCGFMCADNATKYLVKTSGCMIPSFVMSEVLYYRQSPITDFFCSREEPLTEQEGGYVVFYPNRSSQYHLTPEAISCTLEPIDAAAKQSKAVGSSVILKEQRTLVLSDGARITCFDTSTRMQLPIYHDLHPFIQPSRVAHKKKLFKEKFGDRHKHPEKLSVLVIGTDGVSRYNLIRNMPRTYQHLTHHLAAIDFQGYNKIGENSEPNIFNFLTGHFPKELEELGCTKRKGYLDNCSFLFHDFNKEGYVTAVGEDVIGTWAMFTHSFKAFKKQPTDYYFENTYKHAKNSHRGLNYRDFFGSPCRGSKTVMTMVHDYALDLAREMKDVPFFGFYWSSTLTHNELHYASLADNHLMRLLNKLESEELLNNTALFFVSDHGLRYGSFRHTYLGMMEEKLPFVLAVFPPWFNATYPEAWRNLQVNSKRLTSNRDLYQTLKNIAVADFSTESKFSSNGTGQSWFVKIPESRKCADVGIPERQCACEESKDITITDHNVMEAAKVAIQTINFKLKPCTQCAQLQVDKVMSARIVTPSAATMPKGSSHRVITYLVELQAKPGGAALEAMVKKTDATKYSVVDQIIRTNKYGNQSHCIDPSLSELRTYCFCTDLLINEHTNNSTMALINTCS